MSLLTQLLRNSLCLLCLLALGSTLVSAQEEPEGELLPDVRGRKAWFMCTGIPDEVPNPVGVLVDGEVHKVTLSVRHMSNPFPIRGDGMVRLIKPVPDPERPGQMTYKALCTAKVPNQVQQALIILVPSAPGEAEAFRTKVVDLKNFRGGDYMYLNLSPRRIVVNLGGEKKPLEPGAMQIQENREVKKATNTPLSFHYFSEKANDWRLITATTVVVQPTRREIAVFSWDEKYQRINFKGATFPVERVLGSSRGN